LLYAAADCGWEANPMGRCGEDEAAARFLSSVAGEMAEAKRSESDAYFI